MGLETVEHDDCTPEVLLAAARKLFKQKYGHEPTDIRMKVSE
jgi:hypothetical protein